MKINDNITVLEPGINDIWDHSFKGTIKRIDHDIIDVEDQEGNCFQVEINKIK